MTSQQHIHDYSVTREGDRMRAYTESVKGSGDVDKITEVANAVAIAGGRLCAVIDDRDCVPEGMVRIPLQTALSYLDRDSTEWVLPTTSTEGRKVIARLRTDMINQITTRKPPMENTVSLVGADQSTGRKTLMDIQRSRVAKQERMERWG